MDGWEELESWHEDLRIRERFQDELEKINKENLYEMCDFQNRKRVSGNLVGISINLCKSI